MSKTTLYIKNFKQYTEKEFEIDGDVVMMMGKNGSGKSSAIQALETILQVKGFVKDPVNHTKDSADIKYSGKDLQGNPISISTHIEKDGVYSFSAAVIKDGKPKTITDVKKIKELIGEYYPLTVQDVLGMVKYAEGRRTFINDYLHTLIKPALKTELLACQLSVSGAKNKNTDGNLYHSRTDVNKKIELLSAEISASGITEEEKKELSLKNKVSILLIALQEEYEEHKLDPDKVTACLSKQRDIEEAHTDFVFGYTKLKDIVNPNIKTLETIYVNLDEINLVVNKCLQTLNSEIDSLYPLDKLNALKDRISNGKIKLASIEAIEKKSEPTEKINERDRLFKQLEEINASIEKNKARIKEIYQISSFPAGLEIDEDNITLNGYVLDVTTNSETEIMIAIIDLLCNISTSQYVCIGNGSLYDKDSLAKVQKLAQGHKRIFIGQFVSNQEDVTLETLICD